MPQFIVREGFVVTLQKIIKGDKERNIPDRLHETQHFEGETVSLEPEVAKLHAHKLEPLDVEAAEILAPAIVQSFSVDPKQVVKDHAELIARLSKAA